MTEIAPNIYTCYKQKGQTSFSFIQNVAKEIGAKKIGHAGTLDPFAEGVMIVGINEGTKDLSKYVGLDKTYYAEVILGKSTTTLDPEGEIVAEANVSIEEIGEEKIRLETLSLKGKHNLKVPDFSAKKHKGKPLYWYTRKGKEAPSFYREMNVLHSEFISAKNESGKVRVAYRVKVESGVYIRSLTEYLGEKLSTPAYTDILIREEVGGYK